MWPRPQVQTAWVRNEAKNMMGSGWQQGSFFSSPLLPESLQYVTTKSSVLGKLKVKGGDMKGDM